MYVYIICIQIYIILLKYLLLGGIIMGNFFTFDFLIFSIISPCSQKKSNLFFCGSLLKSEYQLYLDEVSECNPEKLIPEVASADVKICVISCCANFKISVSLLFYYLIKYLNQQKINHYYHTFEKRILKSLTCKLRKVMKPIFNCLPLNYVTLNSLDSSVKPCSITVL